MPAVRRVTDAGKGAWDKVTDEVSMGLVKVKKMDIFSKWKASTCKSQLKMAKVRSNAHALRCTQELRQIRREVAAFLEKAQWEKARLKTEHVILLQAQHEAYDILESLCDLLMTRMHQIDLESKVPEDLQC